MQLQALRGHERLWREAHGSEPGVHDQKPQELEPNGQGVVGREGRLQLRVEQLQQCVRPLQAARLGKNH